MLFIAAYNILFHMPYCTICLTNCSQWTMYSILHTMQETVQNIGRDLNIRGSWEISTEANIQTQKKRKIQDEQKSDVVIKSYLKCLSRSDVIRDGSDPSIQVPCVCCTCNALPCSIRGTQETSRACNMLYRSWISDALVCEDHSASHPTGPASHECQHSNTHPPLTSNTHMHTIHILKHMYECAVTACYVQRLDESSAQSDIVETYN